VVSNHIHINIYIYARPSVIVFRAPQQAALYFRLWFSEEDSSSKIDLYELKDRVCGSEVSLRPAGWVDSVGEAH
jgi:hypothetical protein